MKVLNSHKTGRGVSGTPATSKMELFVSLVNSFFCERIVSTDFLANLPKICRNCLFKKVLTNVTKNIILDIAAVLQTHLGGVILC